MTMDGLPYDLTEKQIYHIGKQVLLALVRFEKCQQMAVIFVVSLVFNVIYFIFMFSNGVYIVNEI